MVKLFPALFVALFGLLTTLPGQAADTSMQSVKPTDQLAHAEGVIKALDRMAGTITLAHGPVQELKWPAMTMMFKLAQPTLLLGLTVGKKVRFEFHSQGMSAVITKIKAVG